jgi:hypothetical protein
MYATDFKYALYRVGFSLFDREAAATLVAGQASACSVSAAIAVGDNILQP